jgi:hypothetical protein
MAEAATAETDAAARFAARRVALVVGLVSVAVVALLAATRGGPAWFVKFGTDSAITGYGRSVLGSDVAVPFDEAQDGAQFWTLARDPLLRDDMFLEGVLDRPAYRSQRIAYPWLAAPWRIAGEDAMLWGLVATNVAALSAGAWLTARLAQRLGGRAEIGYVFALNPAAVVALMLDLSEIVALAGLVATVFLVRTERWAVATAAALIAVLAKEAAWPVVAAVALGSVGARLSRRVQLAAVPALCAGVWWFYVRSRFGADGWKAEEFTAVPFGGYLDAWRLAWRPAQHWGDLAAAMLGVAASLAVLVRFVRRRSLELWAALPFALIVPFFSFQVVNRSINLVRGIGPVLLFLLVDWLASRDRHAVQAAVRPAPT